MIYGFKAEWRKLRQRPAVWVLGGIMLAALVGAAVGGAAIHGLHAQAKPKAYTVTELETLDAKAAADAQHLSGNPAAMRRGEQRHHRRHVVRLPEPAKRIELGEFFAVGFEPGQVVATLDEAERNRIRRRARPSELARVETLMMSARRPEMARIRGDPPPTRIGGDVRCFGSGA